MQLFLMLNSVSGVGPRLALALLSSLGVSNLQQAIFNGDIASLSSAPGVGRRTAGRTALELKSKIDEGAAEIGISEGSGDGAVIEALMALGYTAVDPDPSVDSWGQTFLTRAPVLLVLGYCVLIPISLFVNGRGEQEEE